MTCKLKQLLPADLSNETAFQLVKFARGLACALERIYFDMLEHTNECEHAPKTTRDENSNPF